MALLTSVTFSFTPIRRKQIVLQSAAMIAAVQHDLSHRADQVISGALEGYNTSKPVFYQRTHPGLGASWRKRQDGVGVRVYNGKQGTNWSNQTVRYAQFVYGTMTDPESQGPYQQDWPLIFDLVNRYFLNAARDHSAAYSKFLQRVIDKHFS